MSDDALVRQLSYIKAFLGLLSSATSLAQLRSGSVGQTKKNVEIPFSETAGEAAKKVQMALRHAIDMQSLPHFATSFNPASHAGGHLFDFDHLLEAKHHSAAVLKLAKSELSIWSDAWAAAMTAHIADIEAGIPAGWSLQKADLLSDSNSGIVSSLLHNTGFQKLSTATAALCEKFSVVQTLRRNSGENLLPAETWESSKSALASGTETVSITYALHQLLKVIPKLSTSSQQKAAVTKLRTDMRKRGVELGASLAAECSRIEALA